MFIKKLYKIFLNKEESLSNVNKAVSDMHENHLHSQYISQNAKLLGLEYEEKVRRIESLSKRERETFFLLREGFTLKECADQMGLKYSTVNTHMTNVYKKLGINTRAELIINYHDVYQR